jgi:spore maturation protein CgeD
MKKVSIILTSYNKAELLRDAIASVLSQTYENWELLVIDDNSTDASWAVIQKAAVDERVKPMKTDIVDEPGEHKVELNRYTHNINIALQHATGDYISYLCDDDLYFPLRLAQMVHFLDTHPDVMICYGCQEIRFIDEKEEWSGGYRFSPPSIKQAAQAVDHSSIMHRRELISEIGYWPEGKETWRMGDAAFFAKINAKYPFHLATAEPTDCHRYSNLSVSYQLDNPVCKETVH